MINLEIKWLDEFLRKFNELDVDKTLNRAIKISIIELEWTAKKETPVDTGLLRWSYETFFSNLSWKLQNKRKYWIYVHEWTKYIKSNPFLERTIDKEEPKIERIFNWEINKMLNTLT